MSKFDGVPVWSLFFIVPIAIVLALVFAALMAMLGGGLLYSIVWLLSTVSGGAVPIVAYWNCVIVSLALQLIGGAVKTVKNAQ